MWKNQLFSILVVVGMNPKLYSQRIVEDDVPINVLTIHYHHYHNAETSFWNHQEDHNRYVAGFLFEGQPYEALYSQSGEILEEKKELDLSELHPPVYTHISKRYKKFKVLSLFQVSRKKHDEFELVYYEVRCKTKEGEIEVFLDLDMETVTYSRLPFSN